MAVFVSVRVCKHASRVSVCVHLCVSVCVCVSLCVRAPENGDVYVCLLGLSKKLCFKVMV